MKDSLKRCVLSFKWNVDRDNELWASGSDDLESWSNDRKDPLTQRCSDIWDGQNR